MHIHILGICGTFMAGIALIARELGHKVTGSDQNVYPPMSTLLENENITLITGFDPAQLNPKPDLIIIGNAISRGNPCVEYILNHNLNHISAPQWLHDNVLKDRWVIAVAGTHGKTSTASMVNWILEKNNYNHGFLIGGIPGNFNVSARLGKSEFFVIEADEYDCAFFDKRSKFVHYNPKTLILNNLEFDHADIFADLNAIKIQFHHLVRIVPQIGKIISPKNDENLNEVIQKGCWSELDFTEDKNYWFAEKQNESASKFNVFHNNELKGNVNWKQFGEHNMHNALAAISAANHIGILVEHSCEALNSFTNAKRRLELLKTINEIQVFDDFAHHPTAIKLTIEALKNSAKNQRILAVLEPRSNTMKLGVIKNEISPSLANADEVFLYQPESISWSVEEIAQQNKNPTFCSKNIDELVEKIILSAKPGDRILIMSNGGFGGIHQKIIEKLEKNS